jgi:hypothetical protein
MNDFDDAHYRHPDRHDFDPDLNGRCQFTMPNGFVCGSTQSYSVLHINAEADFRQLHNHGGGDCMCFENEDGPSWSEALAKFKESYR